MLTMALWYLHAAVCPILLAAMGNTILEERLISVQDYYAFTCL